MANVELKKDFKDGQFLYGDDLNNNFKVIEAGINANEKNLQNVIDQAQEDLRNELEEITGERGWDWNDNSGERVTFYKGDTNQVNEKPISNGQLLYDITTGETALDTGGKRVTTGAGNVLAVSEEEPTNPGTKVWIKPNELQKVDSTEVIDSLKGNETNLAPSVRAVKNAIKEVDDKNNYSTEEQVIGTWEGKPLYRRTIKYTVPNSSSFVSVFELEDFLDIQIFYGSFFYKTNNRQKYPLPYGEGQYFNNVSIEQNKILAAQNGFDKSPCTLVIEYTKTTD